QGTSPVASMVVFIDGQPKTAELGRLKIKTVEGANDFASMAEILGRRFKRWEHTQGDAGQAEFVEGSEAAYEAVDDEAELRQVEEESLAATTNAPHSGPAEAAEGETTRRGRPSTDNGGADTLADDEREDDGLLGWGALPDLVIVDGGK